MEKHFCTRLRLLFATVGLLSIAGCAATNSAPDYSAALANSERPQTEVELDPTRKPSEVLAFYGVKKGDKVADIWAARGYYTAILSQVVGPHGVVYSANPSSRPEFTDRWKQPIYANIRIVDRPFDKIELAQD